MKRLLPILLFFSLKYFSQDKTALQFYNDAVVLYNKKEYKGADSLFTKSLEKESTKDSYFSRALCRGKMANKAAYCEDLIQANNMGDERAGRLFVKSCGRIDTAYPLVEQKFTQNKVLSKVITYHLSDSTSYVHKQKYASQKSDSVVRQFSFRSEVDTVVETTAEFPGGTKAMMKFIQENIRYPAELRERGRSGKVFLRFTIFEDGTLHDFHVLKSTPPCSDCIDEAARVIAMMPRWKPATMYGKKVKCYFNFPFSFKVM